MCFTSETKQLTFFFFWFICLVFCCKISILSLLEEAGGHQIKTEDKPNRGHWNRRGFEIIEGIAVACELRINGWRISPVRGLWGAIEVRTRSPGARRAHLPLRLLRIDWSCSQSCLYYLRQAMPIQNRIGFKRPFL